MIVPLSARGRTLGAMTLVWAESGRTYSSADLALAQTLAARVALVIDNARLYRDRDHIARTLQQSLLPPEPPSIDGIDLAARYRPAGEGIEVGGDFYDAFDIGDGEWTVALGDVCGKGPDAAALMGMVRHTIRAAAIRERAPARVLATVNAAVGRQTSEEQFCTAVAARLRPQGDQVIAWICVAGHPPPVILRSDGSLQWIRGAGALLGVFDDAELAEDELRLGRGRHARPVHRRRDRRARGGGSVRRGRARGRPARGGRCHGLGDRRPDRGSRARPRVRGAEGRHRDPRRQGDAAEPDYGCQAPTAVRNGWTSISSPDPVRDVRVPGEPGVQVLPVGELDEEHRPDHVAGLIQDRPADQHVARFRRADRSTRDGSVGSLCRRSSAPSSVPSFATTRNCMRRSSSRFVGTLNLSTGSGRDYCTSRMRTNVNPRASVTAA